MKRCNNCGWFNLDSAERCEKCDEDSFEPIVEEPAQEERSINIVEDVTVEQADTPLQEEPIVRKPMNETVAFGTEMPALKPANKSLAATVMDTSAGMREATETKCPKCCYPIMGHVEYCPNCGATIRNEVSINSDSSGNTAAISRKFSSNLKATVPDIPEDFLCEEKPETYQLIPIDASGESPVVMCVGDVVVLGGRKYRFQK